MPRKSLTEEGVRKLSPPSTGQVDFYDAVMPGLVLRVNYGGRKTWRALYYVKGVHKTTGKARTEPRTHPLGKYPIMNLKEAREAARRFLADPQKGLNATETGSFKAVAETYVKREVEGKLRTEVEIKRCIDKYIMPKWQAKTFCDIKRADVADLIDKIEDDHGMRQADVVLGIIRKITNWHEARSDDYRSPVTKSMKRYKSAEHERNRILFGKNGDGSFYDDELRAFWSAAGEMGSFGALLRTLLMTGARKTKVATMKWSDISADGVWTIATEKGEKSNAGLLRLPPMLLDIIAALPRIAGNPYVFAVTARAAPNSFIKPKAELDRRMRAHVPGMEPWVIHDLRRTARSLLSRVGVQSHTAERVLGHVIRGVEGVYDRHDYEDEKADALQRLAALVERIVSPADNVVPLRS